MHGWSGVGAVCTYGSPIVRPLQVRGDIEFSNVRFSYPTRPDRVVLHGLSLTITAGHTVAVLGPSGSGKPCIINGGLAVHSEP